MKRRTFLASLVGLAVTPKIDWVETPTKITRVGEVVRAMEGPLHRLLKWQLALILDDGSRIMATVDKAMTTRNSIMFESSTVMTEECRVKGFQIASPSGVTFPAKLFPTVWLIPTDTLKVTYTVNVQGFE